MSISSLANSAAARRPDFFPPGVPNGLAEVARAADTPPVLMPSGGADYRVGGAPPPPPQQNANAVNTALNVLFGYIPTEVLTLYVAVLAAIGGPQKEEPGNVPQVLWVTFWIFLFATPIVVWLVYGAKLIAVQRPIPLALRTWPLWEMFAATVAYCAWAFALPNTPFSDYSWYSSGLAGLAVLVASTMLGLLAPFFQRPLGT
jgi:hypothetical protein